MKNSYYAHGKFFDSEEEFWKFSIEWPDMPFDLAEFKRQMDIRVKEAEMNYELRGGNLTNRQAYQILRMSTDWIADKCSIEETNYSKQ